MLSYGGACQALRPSPVVCEHSTKQCLAYFLIWCFDRKRGGCSDGCGLPSGVWGADNFWTTFSRSFPITGVSSVGLLSHNGSCRKDALLHPAILATITPLPPVCMV